MAGRPKRRARLAATGSSSPGIPDALSSPTPKPTHAHARAREAPGPLKKGGGYLGGATRSAADNAAASELNDLARSLRPGAQVRIERVRPSWAAGWIEDLTLDMGGLGELYEHLQEEWGGKTYRCTVLLPNGAPAFETRIEIAGPPLHEGSEVDREEWNGAPGRRERERERERERIPNAATAPAAPQQNAMDTIALVKMMLDMQREASAASMASVRELTQQSAAQNQGLIQAIVEGRSAERGPNLVQQLGELEQAKRALDRMGRVFGAADRGQAEPENEDMLQGAVKEAAKHFLGGVLASEFAGKMGPQAPTTPPRAPAPTGPRAVPTQRPSTVRPRPTVAHRSGIPDALQSGQIRRSS